MTAQVKDFIREARKSGRGYLEIATTLSLPVETVKSFCRRHNLLDRSLATQAPDSTCRHCGKKVDPGVVCHNRKFCSDKCRYSWWNAHREVRQSTAMSVRTCATCGVVFSTYKKEQKYCSRQCYFTRRFGKGIICNEQ